MSISRRDALKNLLVAGAATVAARAEAKPDTPVRVEDPRSAYPLNRATEDLYRQELAQTMGDGQEKGFAYHCVNCQGNCAWEVWTKDGKVTRENQSAKYPQLAPDIPDANPRGCNKGVQHSQVMYEADRLLYPMKRAGARGEGKWKRVSWDEALTEVAQHLYDTLLTVGPAGNYVHVGAGVLTEARAAAIKRLGALLGAVRPYIASYVGDMFPGTSVVYGEGNLGCTYDFLYTTDLQVFWGCNPNTSRIPDAHYVWEGKYNGSKVVVVSPELSSSAIHADVWIPVRPGYDGHLALSVLHRMVYGRLYQERLLQELTDLPFLVRKDDGRLLRLSEVDETAAGFDGKALAALHRPTKKKLHPEEVFCVFDTKAKKVSAVPGCEGSPNESLRLTDVGWDLSPALEGQYAVKLKSGKTVQVTPAFALFKQSLRRYSPEKMQKLTGVHPAQVDALANDLAKAKNAVLTLGFSVGKHFNGMLSQRAISSLMAFTGRLGPFGGLNTENEWNISGLEGLSGFEGRYRHRFASGFVSEFVLGDQLSDYDALFDEQDVRRSTGRSKAEYRAKVEGLLQQSAGDAGFQKGKSHWREVQTFLLFADARFRRNKGSYRDAFLKKAKFLAYGDYRMSDFAQWADVLLPCKSHYEVWDLRTNPGYHRFANLAIPPPKLKNVGEAKSEWEIATLLVEKLQALAKAKHDQSKDEKHLRVADPTHTAQGFRPLDELVKEFTKEGKLRSDKDAVEYALEHVDQFKPETVKSAYERGGFLVLNDRAGKSSPLYKDKPYNTFETNRFLHQRFDTLSGRLTFYVDHPLWLEAGAALPAAQEPIRPKRFPLLLMTPHARWSIHSTYKTSPTLLRLQRGKPYVMVNPQLAQAKGIRDGDEVRLFNDLGEVFAMAKLAPGVPPGAVLMEHGWEPFMYRGKKGHNQLHADMLNLLELSDGWGHLKFGTHWDGNQHAYDATVDLSRA